MALAALTLLTVAACGGPDETDSVPSSPPERPADSRSTTQSHSAGPEPSVSAADGRDTTACADGDCEIAVSEPVTLRFEGPDGPATLSVTEVGPNKVEYTVKSGNGQSKGGASGPGQGCVTVLRENGSGNSCGGLSRTRPSAQPDAVVIQATTEADGTALLHIVSH
ncbi:hypothetical protein [Streptomyces pactum]|uniref:Uncharacterized protein n=1 Tax=Streptomyces pactum TaxID=68249 RepID=A0A1S6J7P7_9ACTN|nr:hypothetical protein [Streptomyces pactum]AQS67797.1 hypothetical protein B1H29_13460 [Streptomyces pactum]